VCVHSEDSSVAASADCAAPDADDCDTVGAIAVDARGNFAYATSTGGITAKDLGRVGDCPLIGDNQCVGAYFCWEMWCHNGSMS